MREPQEDEVEPARTLEVERLEDEVGVGGAEARVQVGGAEAGLGVTGGVVDLEVGMVRGEPQELGAGETRRTDDADAYHVA